MALEKLETDLLVDLTAGIFTSVGVARVIYHPPTSQTLIFASARPSGDTSNRLVCWMVRGGVITGPVNSGVAWSSSYLDLHYDSSTGLIIAIETISSDATIVRLAISVGGLSVYPLNSVNPALPARFPSSHPISGSAIDMGTRRAVLVLSGDAIYMLGFLYSSGGYKHVARKVIWTGTVYEVSTDADIVLDNRAMSSSSGNSAIYDQASGRFFISASERNSPYVTWFWYGTVSGGVFTPGTPTSLGTLGSMYSIAALSNDNSLVVGRNFQYSYMLTSGQVSAGALSFSPFPWSEEQVSGLAGPAANSDGSIIGLVFNTSISYTTFVVFIDPEGELISGPHQLAASGSYLQNSLAYNSADGDFHVLFYEQTASGYGGKGLNLLTIGEGDSNFWTNFAGQTEIV